MRKIHSGLLIAMFPALMLLIGGIILESWLFPNNQSSKTLSSSLFLNWRAPAMLGMGGLLGSLILQNYRLVRDDRSTEYMGISMSIIALFVLIPILVLSNFNHWLILAYYLVQIGEVLLGSLGVAMLAAIIGEIQFRRRLQVQARRRIYPPVEKQRRPGCRN